jgi:hypothetical protein
MAYVTLDEVKLVLARVLSIYDSDDTHLQLIVDATEGMINASIASRYTIPATSDEAVDYIKAMIFPIVRFKTWTQFADQEDIPEGVIAEYKSTMKQLDNLAKRITSLPNEEDKETGRASHIKISTSSSPIAGY